MVTKHIAFIRYYTLSAGLEVEAMDENGEKWILSEPEATQYYQRFHTWRDAGGWFKVE